MRWRMANDVGSDHFIHPSIQSSVERFSPMRSLIPLFYSIHLFSLATVLGSSALEPALPNCTLLVGPITFSWDLDGDAIEFQVEAAVDDPQGSWIGIGFAEGSSTVRMAPSNVVISGFVGPDAFASTYELTQRSSSGVNPSAPDAELIAASVREDGVMTVRARRALGSWPVDGSSALVWAMGVVGGTADAPVVMYHRSSRAPGGTTGTIVLSEAQNTC